MTVNMMSSYNQLNSVQKLYGSIQTRYLDNGFTSVSTISAVPTAQKFCMKVIPGAFCDFNVD